MVATLTIPLLLAGCAVTDDETASSTTDESEAGGASSPAGGMNGGQAGAAWCQPRVAENTASTSGTVANERNSFSYTGQVVARTVLEQYNWQNDGRQARASWGGQAATGTMTLELFDGCGESKYKSAIGTSTGTSLTERSHGDGAPGTWLVQLSFEQFTGNMGLSVTTEG